MFGGYLSSIYPVVNQVGDKIHMGRGSKCSRIAKPYESITLYYINGKQDHVPNSVLIFRVRCGTVHFKYRDAYPDTHVDTGRYSILYEIRKVGINPDLYLPGVLMYLEYLSTYPCRTLAFHG